MSNSVQSRISNLILFLVSFIILAPGNRLLAQGVATPPAEKETRDFALQIEQSIIKGDQQAFNNLIDWDSIIVESTKEFESFSFMKEVLKDFRVGMKQGITSPEKGMAANIVNATQGDGSYKLLRVHKKGGQTYALFRMVTSRGGVNYHDMLVEKSATGLIRVKDVFVVISGEKFTETLNRTSLPYVQKLRTEKQKDLSDQEKAKIAEVKIYLEFMGSANSPENLLAIYERLPSRFQNTKHSLLLRMNAANNLGKDDLYLSTINAFQKLYSDSPVMDLISIDHYIAKKNYDGALKAIDGVEKQVGYDPQMEHLRSEIYFKKGDYKTALKLSEKSIAAEPTLLSNYWTVLGISLKTQDYELTAKYLGLVENKLNIPLLDLKDVSEYSGFVASPQYPIWLKSRKKKQE